MAIACCPRTRKSWHSRVRLRLEAQVRPPVERDLPVLPEHLLLRSAAAVVEEEDLGLGRRYRRSRD